MSLTPQEAAELAAAGYADPGLFCRTFLPEWFPKPMPWVHRGILALLTKRVEWLTKFGEEVWPSGKGVWTEAQLAKILHLFRWSSDPTNNAAECVPIFEWVGSRLCMRKPKNTLLILPRGVAKTTLVNAANLYSINYNDEEFVVYASETATHAEQQLGNVKRELESNSLMRVVFGNKVPARSDLQSWTAEHIETLDGVIIVAKGRGAQIRGLNVNSKRPRKIIIDDAEDKESVKTEEQREKARIWFKADVEPALPQIDKTGEIIVLGTILHPEALIVKMSEDPDFATVKFGAVDPDGDALWDEYLTVEEYERKKISFQRLGQLPEFYMEYASSVSTAGEDAIFDPSKIVYVARMIDDFVARGLAVDPAISPDKKSDFCAFGVVGITDKGRLHVCDVYSARGMSPRDQIDKYFELKIRWNTTHHGVEAIAYQRALIHLLQEEMFRKAKVFGPKVYHEITPITHGRIGKKARIKGVLAPRYAAGYITHQRRFGRLETQMVDFNEKSDLAKDDDLDVVAMAVTLLDPYAALAMDEEAEEKFAKDESPPLEEVVGQWRRAP